MTVVAVYGLPGKLGILDIALYGISGIHGSRYNPRRLPLPDAGIAGTLYCGLDREKRKASRD